MQENERTNCAIGVLPFNTNNNFNHYNNGRKTQGNQRMRVAGYIWRKGLWAGDLAWKGV